MRTLLTMMRSTEFLFGFFYGVTVATVVLYVVVLVTS